MWSLEEAKSIVEKAISEALRIANDPNHGYSQTSRWGPDYDCSSLVILAFQLAGIGVKDAGATYTGNMKPVFMKCGFVDVISSVNLAKTSELLRGDVLLNIQHHTAIYLGDGKIVQASINEKGTISGGIPGDQTGNEIHVRNYFNYPWDCVLRLSPLVENNQETPAIEDSYIYHTVKKGDTLWSLATKYLGKGYLYKRIAEATGIDSYKKLVVGQVLRIPTESPKTPKGDTEEFSISLPLLKEGDNNNSVKSLQLLLIGNNVSCGPDGADGDFGPNTRTALCNYQSKSRIPVTGTTTIETWESLLK